jgi:hypothetical protein
VNGAVVVPLDATKLNNGQACTTAALALVAEIASNPAGFYVNAHTTQFPGGALRAQLSSSQINVTAAGSQEVPPSGVTGTANVVLSFPTATQVCAAVTVQNLTGATAMHIHRGAAGTNGPVVIPFDASQINGGTQCVTVAADLASEIATTPAGFYFNIHTAVNPGGAIRGQLAGTIAQAPPPTTVPPATTSPVTTVPGTGAVTTAGPPVGGTSALPSRVNAGNGGQAADESSSFPSTTLVVVGVALVGIVMAASTWRLVRRR